jgi:hypothetical protein
MKCAELLRENNLRLSKQLKKMMSTREAYEILDSSSQTVGSTWSAGGCAVLAYALHKILPESQIIDIVNTQTRNTEHVAVVYQNRVYDANGSVAAADFVDRFKKQELISADLKMVPHNAGRTKRSDIPIDPALIDTTVDYLTNHI